MTITENEIWKVVVGFEGRYEVSNYGEIASINFNRTGKRAVLKQMMRGKYLKVGLWGDNGLCKQISVHRIVATAFHPNPENKPTVNHDDLNKLNNRADNLSWATLVEQMAHVNKLCPINVAKGFRLPHTKLSNKSVGEIRAMWDTKRYMQKEIAEVFGVLPSYISEIVNFKKRI